MDPDFRVIIALFSYLHFINAEFSYSKKKGLICIFA
jgi:hypothetical protein